MARFAADLGDEFAELTLLHAGAAADVLAARRGAARVAVKALPVFADRARTERALVRA